ncbi:sigma-70 family RNA polymerase sigma factor [Tellurirhabdus rosea]|uniref:sigma-70 family RNA polymerase sigma factor n=1 Tax=Tellurirhabdus rosea TaxID=2674997 RepID=UPI00224C8C2E|nr:sigma-70 family RNA polymerase sigma factor [Tellurirhabdus rosea]
MAVEKALVRQLRAANPEAFRLLFEQYAPRIYQFAAGYLKQPAQTEEVVRQVFVRLWEKRWTLDDDLSLNGYLFTLTYHQVLAAFRELHSVCRTQEVLLRLTTRSGNSQEERLLYQDWENVYQQAVTRLPLRQRKIFLLSRDEGLSDRDIAELLRLPLTTVVGELSKALNKVGKHFDRNA